ncbi:hypothetical protein JZK55_01000 [Dissulfurispira thermophila]|uniref:Uncharacterized protein n=2 Tax=root TaxID=1 RepID=A0A7G1GYB8_9BACT|nr:hypothetical protein [Dissulfurispira thermophila]BCB95178.1 hypothetical protein JZK55_01000 [Dissulfurispira thermophila]
MPVNQASNNQLQTDMISKYDIQKKKNTQSQQSQRQMQQMGNTERNNPTSEDVRVSLSKQAKTRNADRTTINIPNEEAQQKTQGIRNIESEYAVQAYQNTNRTAENTRAENTRQKQINRIVG